MPAGSSRLRRDAARAVRRGQVVTDPAAAPLAIAFARNVQKQPTWPWVVIIPAVVLGALGVWLGGFALFWYFATVVPALATEPWRARRRRNKALAAEAANLSLVEWDEA